MPNQSINFHGQNLRGKSFKNQNLSQANFSKADIRGADFTGANLIGADFSEVQAGLSLKSKIILVLILLIFSGFVGFLASLAGFWIGFYLTWTYDKLITSIIFYLILILVFLIINTYKGLLLAIGIMPLALAVTAPVADVLTNIGIGYPTAAGAGAGIAVVALAGFMLVALAIKCTQVITKKVAILTIILGVVGAAIGTLVGMSQQRFTSTDPNPSIHAIQVQIGTIMAFIVTSTLPILSSYIAWISLPLDKNSNFLPGFTINFAAIGGTSFRNANLTEANFTRATLNNTDFEGANTTRTRWFQAKLQQAKLYGTILSNSYVRDLLVTLRVNNTFQNFTGLNFKGANLAGAELSYIDLTEADISDATFAGAFLEYANLTKTQAIKTNFQQTRLTGACLEAWNIDSTTELSGAICEYVYLLNNQRERRPSSGEFQPGEFTKLFEEVLDTVDLIFRNGIDWKAFAYSFNQLQVENAGTELFIRSIENKGDGIVVVRVDVPEGANKEKIYSDFSQFYDTTIKIVEEKYRSELENKDRQIDIYRQHLSDLQKVLQLFEKQPIYIPKNKLVILKLGVGDFDSGFPVILQIGEEAKSPSVECVGKLPPCPDIEHLYKQWQLTYRQNLSGTFRIDVPKRQNTNFSNNNLYVECNQAALNLKNYLNWWLNSEHFRSLKDQILEELNRDDTIRIILQTENKLLHCLPWHLWDLFERYLKAEIAISNTAYRLPSNRLKSYISPKSQVRILAIFGYSSGINLEKDRVYIERLAQDAEVTYLTEPTRKNLQEQLWHQTWEIIYFAGHSSSHIDGMGYVRINKTETLSINDLKYGLSQVIDRGLKIAIFNSCDGLGLAFNLANLHIPQIIVMRELVPDEVAQEFLINFLKAFVGGKSLYQSVRDAREQLHHWETYFPCATWLPLIFQNPAEIPPTWDSMLNLK